jgi:hypothetical protein
MKPDTDPVEHLMAGHIRQPSARFEAELADIPRMALKRQPAWLQALKPLAVAALLLLGLFLALPRESALHPSISGPGLADKEPVPLDVAEKAVTDENWMELFTLAETVAMADLLTDPDLRGALDYYAFQP